MARVKAKLLIDSNAELYKELNFELNEHLDCSQLRLRDERKVWWTCKENPKHVWQTKVRNRSVNGSGCLYCAKKLAMREDSLGELYPHLLDEWDYKKNGDLDPFTLLPQSNKNIYWICRNNSEHSWEAPAFQRTHNGTGCRVCGYATKKPRGPKQFLVKSYPHIAKEWDYERNRDVDINSVTHGSSYDAWWVCHADNTHKWQSTVVNRTSKHRGCPICSGSVPSAKSSLASLYPEVAKEWHLELNAPLKPDEVTRASGRTVWWRCARDPEHEWEAEIRNRTTLGSKCPHCNDEVKLLRLWGYFLETDRPLSNEYKQFVKSLFSVEAILKEASFSKDIYEKALYRLLFASVITAMETYLSDLFMSLVLPNDQRLGALLLHNKPFNTKKYTIAEAISFSGKKREMAEGHLTEMTWHNLSRVSELYKSALGINLEELVTSDLVSLVVIRHDIVHRNGRKKNGSAHQINDVSVRECIKEVKTFVEKVEVASQALDVPC